MKTMTAIFTVLMAISTTVSLAADFEVNVWYPDKEFSPYDVTLNGDIVEGDSTKLLSLIKRKEYMPDGLTLISNGGSVGEAVKIGRFVRRSLMGTWAYAHKPCFSSCFFVFVSGVFRNYIDVSEFVEGGLPALGLGIHRPYYSTKFYKGLTPEEAEKEQDEAHSFVREYLLDMGIRPSFVEELFTIPSSEMKTINESFFHQNIGLYSAGYEEWLIANCGPWLSEKELEDWGSYLDSKSISKNYYDHLEKKRDDWVNCRENRTTAARKHAYKQLFY